ETRLGGRKSLVLAQLLADRVCSDPTCYLRKVSFLDECLDSPRVPVHADPVKGKDALLEFRSRSLLGNLFQLPVVKLVDVILALSKQPTVRHSPLITRVAIREIYGVNRPRLFHSVENLVGGSHSSEFE